MSKHKNISTLLKNHIGKRFYNPLYGYVTLMIATDEELVFVTKIESLALYLDTNGTVFGTDKLGVFPRAFADDWNEWIEQHSK